MKWRLRRATMDDADQLHLLCCVPEVFRYLADGAAPPRARIVEWIENSLTHPIGSGMGMWMLQDGEASLAGAVSLAAHDLPRSAELIYLLHPRCWGRGLATRMSWSVMQHAFAAVEIDQIIAGTDLPNRASLAVMHRLAMRFHRDTQYPAGPGVEYIYRRGDPLPVPLPAPIPIAG